MNVIDSKKSRRGMRAQNRPHFFSSRSKPPARNSYSGRCAG
ncbi:hypothetical protein SM11_chr3445 [Sinorhizobium meliloti SM11]|uniref:Uncharacterized protein n=1 Tax=Sinorhizobium meliloti (strain SM11) TaxID=707241 RepID=F7X1W6_SINMM|nr:hypothetical protein SM11_chr3445 [Sinorhizobium meliloti SM11]